MTKGRHHGGHDHAAAWPALTPADLAGMPDNGRRYELVDGTLVVSLSP